MKPKPKKFVNNFSNYKRFRPLSSQQVKQKLKHKVAPNRHVSKAKLLSNKVRLTQCIDYDEYQQCNCLLILARLKAEATRIEAEAELSRLKLAREAELKYLGEQNEQEISKRGEMSRIETEKFKLQVESIGASTIQAIATSGPDTQVKLLQALGLQSMLVTDGNSPINLMGFGQGLLGGITGNASKNARASITGSSQYHVEGNQ
jgi:hypothetical protein